MHSALRGKGRSSLVRRRDWGRRFSIVWSARRTFRFARERGLDEAFEERMRFVRFALELGVILAADEVRMIAQFD